MESINKNNKDEGFLCPRCGDLVFEECPALSRRDYKTKICSDCGTDEAMFDYIINLSKFDYHKLQKVEKLIP